MADGQDGNPAQLTTDLSTEEQVALIESHWDIRIELSASGTIGSFVETAGSEFVSDRSQLVGYSVSQFIDSVGSKRVGADVTNEDELLSEFFERKSERVTVVFKNRNEKRQRYLLRRVGSFSKQSVVCLGRVISEENTYETVWDQFREPMFLLDENRNFLEINTSMATYTGYNHEALLGRPVSEIISPEEYERFSSQFRELVIDKKQETARIETAVITNSGEIKTTEVSLALRTDSDGNYNGSIGTFRDITAQKRRINSLELLNQILTRVFRHNVRNNVMVINGHAELLADSVDRSLHEHTDKILETTDKLLSHSNKARLIEAVLETDELTTVDIASKTTALVEQVRSENPDATIAVSTPSACQVTVHPYIDVAIRELIENGITHAPEREPASIEIWIETDAATPILFIEDESGGLNPEEIAVIREGNEQKLAHSSGVGLWLVRWVVVKSQAELVAHPTTNGTLMGIKFGEDSPKLGLQQSPLARTPEHVREKGPETFRGETIIGRTEANEELLDSYRSLNRTGGHSVLITGESGIGKTTLVKQFLETVESEEPQPLVATGLCAKDGQAPYHPFRQLFRSLSTDRELTRMLDEASSLTATDASEVEQLKQGVFSDVTEQLRALATEQPIVLVIEDLQWADNGTVSLFEHLIDEVGYWSYPVLFLGTYRSSGDGQSRKILDIAARTVAENRGTIIELEPFDKNEVRKLLSSIIGAERVSDSFIDAVYEHTGGTPFFVSELAYHFESHVDEEILKPETVEHIAVPKTVESAVTERLETLPSEVVPVLRTGALIGLEFRFDVLRHACTQPVEEIIEAIDLLVHREIWIQSADTLSFSHGIIRDRALADLPDKTNQVRRVTDAIEAVYEGELETHATRLAGLYERVEEYAKAQQYYKQAASHAADRYALDDAIEQYRQALSIAQSYLEVDTEKIAAILGSIAELQVQRGAPAKAQEIVSEALSYASEGERRCRLLGIQAEATLAQSDFELARKNSREQKECAESVDTKRLASEAVERLGRIEKNQGQYDEAISYHKEGLRIAKETGDRVAEARNKKGLGMVAWRQGRYEEAEQYFTESLNTAQTVEDRQLEAATRTNLGIVAQYRGEHTEAKRYYNESLEIAERIGDRSRQATNWGNLGIIAQEQGEYEAAKEYFEESLSLKQAVGDKSGIARTLNNLGEVYRYEGEYDQAFTQYEQSLTIHVELDNKQGETVSTINLGEVARERENPEKAKTYYERALELAKEINSPRLEAHTLLGLAAVARKQGEIESAKRYLSEGKELFEETGDKAGIAKCCLEGGQLSLATEETADAREHFSQALELFEELSAVDDILETLRQLLALEQEDGNTERVQRLSEQAYTIISEASETSIAEHREWLSQYRQKGE